VVLLGHQALERGRNRLARGGAEEAGVRADEAVSRDFHLRQLLHVELQPGLSRRAYYLHKREMAQAPEQTRASWALYGMSRIVNPKKSPVVVAVMCELLQLAKDSLINGPVGPFWDCSDFDIVPKEAGE